MPYLFCRFLTDLQYFKTLFLYFLLNFNLVDVLLAKDIVLNALEQH